MKSYSKLYIKIFYSKMNEIRDYFIQSMSHFMITDIIISLIYRESKSSKIAENGVLFLDLLDLTLGINSPNLSHLSDLS